MKVVGVSVRFSVPLLFLIVKQYLNTNKKKIEK
jgi:hypothetical protein